jgi:hypothetical protein
MVLRLIVPIAIGLSTLSNAGCRGHDSPLAPSPPAEAMSFTLSGSVLESTASGSRPAEGVPLFFWVDAGNTSRNFGPVTSDADGRYSVSNVPRGMVYVQSSWSRYEQPCFTSVELRGDTVLDVEVVSPATLLSLGPSSLRNLNGLTVSGVVFDASSGDRRPIAGARLQVWIGDWVYGASTSTDASGRYLLCRFPRGWQVSVYTDKEGYRQHTAEVLPAGNTTLDIPLERR